MSTVALVDLLLEGAFEDEIGRHVYRFQRASGKQHALVDETTADWIADYVNEFGQIEKRLHWFEDDPDVQDVLNRWSSFREAVDKMVGIQSRLGPPEDVGETPW